MLNRRILLRVAVALITFMVGRSAAAFFAPEPFKDDPARYELRVGFLGAPPRLEYAPPAPCADYRLRRAFHRHEWHGADLDFDAPPPPPAAPAPPPPAHRFDP